MENNFRANLTSLRRENNLNQEDLARKIGVTRQAISKWERGDGMPDFYNISQLAKALNVSIDELVGEGRSFSKKNTHDYNNFNFNQSGGFLKKLLYKAKHTTNTEQAKRLRTKLFLIGGIGFITGTILSISGFVGFASGAMNSVGNFHSQGSTFNPLPYIGLFMSGGVIASISVYFLYAGFTIVVAGATTKYLDTRDKCPKCGDEIDADEKCCSKCGYDLVENAENRCFCGKVNQPKELFCRECGEKLLKAS